VKRCFKPHDVVHRAMRRMGIDNHGEGMHTLRRTAARLTVDSLVEQGGHDNALRVVQAMLHHASSATTEVYLGLASETRIRDEFMRTRGVLKPRASVAGLSVIR
jgi:integrase